MVWSQDEHWRKALEVARSLSSAHRRILVPDEFVGINEKFYPVRQANQLELQTITGFAIQKDQITCLPGPMLRDGWFSQFHCVWIDDVFAVYSMLAEPCRFAFDGERHLPAFEAARKALLQELSAGGDFCLL